MSTREWQTILECLKASANGPFFDHDDEFATIFGIDRSELKKVIDEWWIEDAVPSHEVLLAINNSMNNLLGYPHGKYHLWSDYISVSPKEVRRVHEKWQNEQVPLYESY